MSRRLSTPSLNSPVQVPGNGQINFAQAPALFQNSQQKRPGHSSRTHAVPLSKLPGVDTDVAALDPDELFTKFTISEVKSLQLQLRADADAKQEELRVMVGERYRDLLQASTSIISIAKSSQRVRQALTEMKEAILTQDEPPIPQESSSKGGDDAHLRTLQLLSAHIKLLLDAPEHLWRLIERKKYFQAAWLFLLTRVVHRALVRGDENEEGTWGRQIDVLEQFPLVQRQWDAVSQFRPQIIHKATISLREYNVSVEDTCATLLTLHLLDSQPLADTLSVLLGQRSQALLKLLWRDNGTTSPVVPGSPLNDRQTNGHSLETLGTNKLVPDFRRIPVMKVKDVIEATLDVIIETVKTARSVFQEKNSKPSLIRRVLEFIQLDTSTQTAHSETLPTELCLTTQTLLMSLPSSTHFLLFPSNVTSYKPYVDLDSSSLAFPHLQFVEKLDEWFRHSSTVLHSAIERWLSALHNIKEVWSVRSSTRKHILASGLEQQEVDHLISILDNLCRDRVIAIWKLRLTSTLESFGSQLDSSVSSLDGTSDNLHVQDTSPVDFLFKAPPLPVLSHANWGAVDTSLQKYKVSLRHQIVGRTSLLDAILKILENCAWTIRQDLVVIIADSDESGRVLAEQLKQSYRPVADALCHSIINTLDSAALKVDDSSQSTIKGLVLLARVADELSSSPFISEIGCQQSVIEDFRAKTQTLYERIIDRWRKHTVLLILNEHRLPFHPPHPNLATSTSPSGPSSNLIQSLLSLSRSIQELGVFRDHNKQDSLVDDTLRHFIAELMDDGSEASFAHSVFDLAFLWKLASLRGDKLADYCSLLDARIEKNDERGQSDLKQHAAESLARMQTLLATLLPRKTETTPPDTVDKLTALLPYGLPASDQQFQSAIELAKPAPRFGLLLVGGSTESR